MAARQYYYIAATAEATTTASADSTLATLSFTPDDNESYVLMWSCLALSKGVLVDHRVKLTHGTTATLSAANWETKDSTSYRAMSGIAVATFATATGSHSFLVRHSQETATGPGINTKDVHLIAIKLATADAWFYSTATQTTFTSATALQNAATLSFTPSATGDYLIVGAGMRNFNVTTSLFSMLLNVAGTGTDYGTSRGGVSDVTSFIPWMTAAKQSLTASECQVAIRYEGGAVASAQNARDLSIVALRLTGGFENTFFDENRAAVLVTGTSTGAGNFSATLGFEAVATGDHVAIFGGITSLNSLVIDENTQFTGSDAKTVFSNVETGLATDQIVFAGIQKFDATSTATRIWHVGHGIESTGTGASFTRKEGFIALLQLVAGAAGASTFNVSPSATARWVATTVRSGGIISAPKVLYRASLSQAGARSYAATFKELATVVRATTLPNNAATYRWSATAAALKVFIVALDATYRFVATVSRTLTSSVVASATYTFLSTATFIKSILKALSATYLFAATVTRASSFVKALSAIYSFASSATATKAILVAAEATYRWTAAVVRSTGVNTAATWLMRSVVERSASLALDAVYLFGSTVAAVFTAAGGAVYAIALDATYRFSAVSTQFFTYLKTPFSGGVALGTLFAPRKLIRRKKGHN